jgi:hypothetical protein
MRRLQRDAEKIRVSGPLLMPLWMEELLASRGEETRSHATPLAQPYQRSKPGSRYVGWSTTSFSFVPLQIVI